jgi:hypothetical protein
MTQALVGPTMEQSDPRETRGLRVHNVVFRLSDKELNELNTLAQALERERSDAIWFALCQAAKTLLSKSDPIPSRS